MRNRSVMLIAVAEAPQYAAVLGSFLLWTNIYLLLYALLLPLHCSAECTCRIVTTLHAFLLSVLGLGSMFALGPWPFEYLGQSNTELHTDTVVLSLGYFVFDFVWCVIMQTEGLVMLLHHVASMFGFGYVLYSGRYGCEITGVLGASEITNPLVQLRWFLKHGKLYSGTLEQVVDWTFASVFCSIRLGVGSIFFSVFFLSPHVDMIARLGGTGFYVISVVFSIQVALYMYKKYFTQVYTIHQLEALYMCRTAEDTHNYWKYHKVWVIWHMHRVPVQCHGGGILPQF